MSTVEFEVQLYITTVEFEVMNTGAGEKTRIINKLNIHLLVQFRLFARYVRDFSNGASMQWSLG